jgi:hypothetical protein
VIPYLVFRRHGAGELGSIGPSTSLRVEQSSSFGLELGLIGFVLDNVRCSLFVGDLNKP